MAGKDKMRADLAALKSELDALSQGKTSLASTFGRMAALAKIHACDPAPDGKRVKKDLRFMSDSLDMLSQTAPKADEQDQCRALKRRVDGIRNGL